MSNSLKTEYASHVAQQIIGDPTKYELRLPRSYILGRECEK